MPDSPRFSVLFLCTHNSARSQLAEALLRQRAGDRFDVASAGSHPGRAVHPIALELIAAIGADPAAHRSKGFDEVLVREWDLVITVCDQAQESCPALPKRTVAAHWGIPDPSQAEGDDETRRAAFRTALLQLTRRIELFVAIGPEKLERMVLKEQMKRIHEQVNATPPGAAT